MNKIILLNENEIKNNKMIIIKLFRELKVEDSEKLYDRLLKSKQDKTAYFLGTFLEDKLVGILWMYKRVVEVEVRFHINYFIIDKLYRSKGLGDLFIQKSKKISKKENINKIELNVNKSNKLGINFYNKQNFKVLKSNEKIILMGYKLDKE